MKDLLDFRIIKVIINRRWVVFVFLVCLSRIIIDFVPSQTETRLTCEVFFPLLPGNGKSDNGKHKDVNRCCQRGAKNDVQTKNINVPLDEFFCFLLGLAVGKKKKSPNSASQVWLDLLRGGQEGVSHVKHLRVDHCRGKKANAGGKTTWRESPVFIFTLHVNKHRRLFFLFCFRRSYIMFMLYNI